MSGQAGNSEASKNAPERTAHEKQHLHFKATTLYIRALQNAGVFEHDNSSSKRAEAEDEDKYAKFRQGLFDKHFDESASEPGTEGKAGYNTAENDLMWETTKILATRVPLCGLAARSPRVTKPGFTVLGIHAVKNRKARERNKRLGRATAINGLPDNVKALLSKEQIDQLLHD
ncbi:MAG: hypothetical protein Q9228_002228 [Teloschistes exilis]